MMTFMLLMRFDYSECLSISLSHVLQYDELVNMDVVAAAVSEC
jgi:hypothetical protein